MILLFIMIDRYRKQLNRANKWKSDYFAIKSVLDDERNKVDLVARLAGVNLKEAEKEARKKGLWKEPESWMGHHPMDVNEEWWKYETRKRSDDIKPKKKSFKDIDIAKIAAEIKAKKKGLWPEPESWKDRNTGALKKKLK